MSLDIWEITMPRKMKEPDDRSQSTLATFRISAGDWYDFGQLCEQTGMTASQALTIYISECLQSRKINLDIKLYIPSQSPLPDRLAELPDRLAEIENRLAALEKEGKALPSIAA